jgi:hydroxyacylglutathione hydrolase
LLRRVESRGLAHNSYFLADGGEAAVIDPRRDATIYTRLAKRECAKITFILETHRNEDYLVGSLELQNLTDAEILHSREQPFKYGEHNLVDGDTFSVGRLKIRAVYTPGHTNESMCYVVYDTAGSSIPLLVFTEDTLFAGDVGRTDLLGFDAKHEQSAKLYDSLHEKVLPFGDHVIIYPAHGAGSICGHHIGNREFSTVGYEKRTNPLLKLDKEAFCRLYGEARIVEASVLHHDGEA